MGKIRKKINQKSKSCFKKEDTTNKFSVKSTKEYISFEKVIKPVKIHKKKKQAIKKKNLLQKIDLIKKQKEEEINRKKREKTVITGDLKPLKDALPSLDELLKLKSTKLEIKTGLGDTTTTEPSLQKLNKAKKIKKRKQEFLNRYNSFQSLLKDPEYKQNPREAIAFHIRYTNNLEC